MKRRRMQANASARRCTTVALSVLLAPQVFFEGGFSLVLKRFGLPGASREGAWQGVPAKHVLGVFFRWFLGCLVGVLGASWERFGLS